MSLSSRRHVCVTDPTARAWWLEYREMCRLGNPAGLSFVEFVARRAPALFTIGPDGAFHRDEPWYIATCGHQHPWGVSCSASVTDA